ncbi:MAG: OmcA/MtrC family decaheme c-type cytochrome, partial [Desulfobulbaceae bacterium]|nr:OmcA/MtrC family decaheme c-type cytochrome [Desulfobulbaceae bacterium]
MARYTNSSGRIAALMLLGLFLAACGGGSDGADGTDGATGDAGPAGPAGPPGPASGNSVPIDSADMINILVTGVDVPAGGGAPTVFLTLTNDLEQGLRDLPAGDIRFVLSQLSPGVSGGSSEWQSYVSRSSNGVANAQANTETASSGTFVDNGDGSYEYTFAEALTDYAGAPVFDAVKTHRLGVEIRGQAPISSNGIFDFVPAGGALLFERKIVDTQTCDTCHDRLEFHGGPRTDVEYCVTCHNPNSTDEDTGNTVDLKALIHNIHSGRDGYVIIGYRGAVHDYSDIEWSQDIRNCQTCHEEDDVNTPQASNWRLVPNRAACGTCHFNDGDAANGEHDYMIQDGEHPFGLPIPDDTQCLLCHGPDSAISGGAVRIAVAHEIPTQIESERFQYNIENVFDMEVGMMPTVEFSVTNPLDGTYYDILNAVEFNTCAGGASRLAIDVAWDTTDYTNTGSGSAAPAQPMTMNPLTCFGNPGATEVAGNPAGVHIFSVTAGAALPADAVGTAAVTIDGHPAVDIDGVINRIPVTNVVEYVGIDGATTVARRGVIDIQKCDDCHNELSLHGNNRTDNPEVCVTCHNPNATDNVQRVAIDPGDLTDPPTDCLSVYGPDDVATDFKVMIHAIHASGEIEVPYQVCGYSNSAHEFLI